MKPLKGAVVQYDPLSLQVYHHDCHILSVLQMLTALTFYHMTVKYITCHILQQHGPLETPTQYVI